MTESAPVYIVGGGWTGLSAAIELCRKKIPVTLIESGKQLGGKTRRVSFDGKPVDQSQIMLFGGYQNILRLFRTLKIQENQDYERVPFDLILRRKRKTKFRFRHFRLPAPYGIRAAMYLARGMPMQDKIRSLRLIDKIRRQQIN
ncbi:MAG: FAD-dependent oxidoreductase, partial [Gammaproteobacteria bacterium]|nr:FAD-dependent oxidoreductase [Gammaproteobacteria bacterium]